ncbi:MAG TPA: hypothetical protein PLX89_28075, partial [Verrucomicrobiota bacterium]|nr:hypothetical protein [Verrucomicrobiota bacterium]
MRRLGFRLKVVVAMMTVVVLGTGASLFVAQRRVQEAYRKLSEEEFRSQFERFTELQEARLAGVKDKCLDLVSNSVRLRAAMEENDSELTYTVATDELRGLEGPGPRRSRPSFFHFFDASGRLIPPAGSAQQLATAGPQLRREGSYRLIRQVLDAG